MFVEVRTTLNTVLPAHREVLKLLHQVGALEEQEIRAHLDSQPQPTSYVDAKEALADGE